MNKFEIINANAEKVASAIHDVLGTSAKPSILLLLRWIEENFGVKIEINHTYSEEFKQSGLVYYDPQKGCYMVWINANEPEKRKVFTICHEFGHILLNSRKAFGFSDGEIYSKKGEERFCDHFAAAFLMPKDIFIQKWNSCSETLDFKKVRMTSIFKVSGLAIYYRAKELGLIL
ncbi:MAG: ImmA/IrrE family metallo-endopeptidase [Candidatus Moranbacteria bacterium]|nr:ImmA/IrrE family metallo-endopeptidase [Candidatus Moranbacteria bacterium]